MTDVVSIIKDNAAPIGRFLKAQAMVWFRVVNDPLSVISKIELGSTKSVVPAFQFAVFAYAFTIIVASPALIRENVDVSQTLFILSDFVMTFLSFALIGLMLWLAGKLLGGHGGLLESVVAGLYLAAFWPLVQATDYLLSIQLPGLAQEQIAMMRLGVLVIVVLGVTTVLTVKVSPVMAHVHGFGRVRAVIATLVQVGLVFFGILAFLRAYFPQLAGGG